jgi:hypothetical protein
MSVLAERPGRPSLSKFRRLDASHNAAEHGDPMRGAVGCHRDRSSVLIDVGSAVRVQQHPPRRAKAHYWATSGPEAGAEPRERCVRARHAHLGAGPAWLGRVDAAQGAERTAPDGEERGGGGRRLLRKATSTLRPSQSARRSGSHTPAATTSSARTSSIGSTPKWSSSSSGCRAVGTPRWAAR